MRFFKFDNRSAPPAANSPYSTSPDLDASIRSLLQQGRKIDAVQLLRTAEKIGLTMAVLRVNQIDESMKTCIS